MDQGSNKNHYRAYNFAPTVTKFCVMWEGLSLPHDTKFGNCRCEIVDSRAFPSWSLIHGLRWSGLIKAEPGSPRGGGGTPYVMGDTYVPRFWPPFFTLAGSSTIFLGYFFSSTNTKTIFWGIKTTNSYRIRSFRPQISFFPRSFWVQFSAASGTPPSFFGPSTPPPRAGSHCWDCCHSALSLSQVTRTRFKIGHL